MTDEWVLVPKKATAGMQAAASWHRGHEAYQWQQTIAARPPIPRAKWNEMVERGYKALWTGSKYNGVDAALHAALGNPEVADE